MYSKNEPMVVDVAKGETVYFCQCGKTKTPPYCDGSHQGSGKEPLAYTPDTDEQCYICRCGKSGNIPFCDGSHNKN